MIILIILGCLVGFCAIAMIVGYFSCKNLVSKTVGPMAGCAINFEAVRDGIMEYAKEHDGTFPTAANWQDQVKPYVVKALKKSQDAKQAMDWMGMKVMDVDKEWGCFVTDARTTGIAFNSDLSGKKLTDVENAWSTILVFEVESPRRNANEKYVKRPDSTSPTIMGEPRGWIAVPVTGNIEMKGGRGNWNSEWGSSSGTTGQGTGEVSGEGSKTAGE